MIDIDGAVAPSPYPEVCGAACSLPVESDSVDVVLLPHVLEFEPDPHAALREAFRILVPEGYLLISVFNPWSLMGMWRLWGARSGSPPWQGQFLGAIRIKDWLALLGFDVLSSEPCFFRPPLRRERLLQRLACMEAFGKRAFPYLAGANVLVAKKRISTLTPIRPAWKLRRKLAGVGLAGPTAGRVEVPGNARMPAFADQPTNGDHDGPLSDVSRHAVKPTGGTCSELPAPVLAPRTDIPVGERPVSNAASSVDGIAAGRLVEVFTDGACRGNPGPGGWAVLLRYGEREQELSGAEPRDHQQPNGTHGRNSRA